MATYSTSLAPDNSTDANFRAWGKWMSDRLTDMGITKTGDTGQIDWSTVTHPTVANTAQGYEIRQFQDALAGANPVLFKIEYGGGPVSANRPSIWVTIGVSSDGAGTLTGGTTHRQQIASNGNETNLRNCIASGDSGRAQFGMFLTTVTATFIFLSLERSPDPNGAATSEAVLWMGTTSSGPATWFQQAYIRNVANTTVEASLGCLFPVIGHGSDGVNTALYPIKMTKGPFFNECLGAMAAFNANVTPGTPITFPYYGASHTFYPIGTPVTTVPRGTLANTTTLLMRYE